MKAIQFCLFVALIVLGACSEERQISGHLDGMPELFPDYAEVTIPYNIAPLNFAVRSDREPVLAQFSDGNLSFEIESQDGEIQIPAKKWNRLLSAAKGKSIEITIAQKQQGKWMAYAPFTIHVADQPVDPYIAYRLIEPGYALWNQMGIYQRNLQSFDETAVYENKITNYNCVNCHSFCMQNPDRMLFHMRAKLDGTVLINDDRAELLDTKTDQTISALVYPYWHPSGKYVAFSVNKTTQQLHPTNRTEVYDTASDVVVYDIEKHTILSVPAILSKNSFETFPSFSPDGRTLFFCSAPACSMPDSINTLRYSLCSLSFNPETGTFGEKVDTLYNARINPKSVSFPRVSPNGKFLLCTLSDYGTFPVWHKEADLYLIDLQTKTGVYPEVANSDDTDSYHSWSSNSHWVVFSSRRLDGLYTRPFIAYVDKDGNIAKPFLLPQKDTGYYDLLMKSYNIPEFVTGKVRNHSVGIRKMVGQERIPVRFTWSNP